MSGLLRASDTVLRKLAYLAAALGGMVMLVMLAVVTANICMRPFGGSIRGTVEVSGYLCALAVGLCMPAAQMAGSHIAAGLWSGSLPRPVRRFEKLGVSLLCAGLLFLVARELLGIAEYAADMGEYIEGFDVSYYGMALGFAFGIALHGLIFIHTALGVVFPAKEGA